MKDDHLLPLALRPVADMARLLAIRPPEVEMMEASLGAPCACDGQTLRVEHAFLFEFRTDADAIWVTLAYELARLRWARPAGPEQIAEHPQLELDSAGFTAGELLAATHRSPTRAEAALLRVRKRYGRVDTSLTDQGWDALLAGWVSWATIRRFV
jgi:hypothetical protein